MKNIAYNVYRVTADYRPKNPNKPNYNVMARNVKEAKKIFEDTFTWLKVYNVEVVDDKEARKIIVDPYKRPFNYRHYMKGNYDNAI